jgi:hypothetical protein
MTQTPEQVAARAAAMQAAFVEAARRNEWSWLADEFYAPDCHYLCEYGGTLRVHATSREEIRETHYGRDMRVGWEGWSFPIERYTTHGNRIITHWWNRGPGRVIHYRGRRWPVYRAARSVRPRASDAPVRRTGRCGPAVARTQTELGDPEQAKTDRDAEPQFTLGSANAMAIAIRERTAIASGRPVSGCQQPAARQIRSTRSRRVNAQPGAAPAIPDWS